MPVFLFYFFHFDPRSNREMIQFDLCIFLRWVVKLEKRSHQEKGGENPTIL